MNEVLLFSNVSVKHDSKKQNHKKKRRISCFTEPGQVKVLKTLTAVLRAHCSLDLDQLVQLC